MEAALEGLKVGHVPSTKEMGSFKDIQEAVGFTVITLSHFAVLYILHSDSLHLDKDTRPSHPKLLHVILHSAQEYFLEESRYAVAAPEMKETAAPTPAAAAAQHPASSSSTSTSTTSSGFTSSAIEADAVFEEKGTKIVMVSQASKQSQQEGGSKTDPSNRRNQYFRVCISDLATGNLYWQFVLQSICTTVNLCYSQLTHRHSKSMCC